MSKWNRIKTNLKSRKMNIFKPKEAIPPYLRKIGKYVLFGILAYLLFVSCFAIYQKIWLVDLDLGVLQSSDKNAPSDFAISFHASAMESILFFVCSGAIAFFLSITRPEYGDFETKLYYLFPRVNSTEKGKEYCRASINKLACISTKTTVQISIDEYSEPFEAFKLSTEHEYHLLNLHNNIQFNDKLKVRHKLDDANPTDFGNHCWGQIRKIRTVANHRNPDECLNIISTPIPLTKADQECPFDVSIKPNDNLILDISSWTWNKFKSPLNSRVGRFTEMLEMKITNNSNKDINLIIHNNQNEEVTLNKGDSYTLHNDVATPNEVISYSLKV
ncbi:TPA: hypothetical protein ACX6Q1_002997 [Photobacterium damselae]